MMNGRENQNGHSQIQPPVEQKEFDQLPTSSWPVQGTNRLTNFAQTNQPTLTNPNAGPYSNQPMPANPNAGSFTNQPMPINQGLQPQWHGLQPTSVSFVDSRSMQRQELMVHQNVPLPANRDISTSSQFPVQKNKKLMVIYSLLGIVLLLGALGGYYLWKKANATSDVTLYQVNSQNVVQDIGGSGIAYAKTEVDLSYPLIEKITDVYVHTGDHVKANQVLLQIDATQTQAQIEELENEAAQALAYLQSVENGPGANSVSIAQAQQAYNIAKGKYDSLVSQFSSVSLAKGQIVSPINGVVTAVNANEGDIATPYSPIITVMDESTILVHAEIPLSNLGQVTVGESAIVTPSAIPNLNLNGTVTNIIQQANAQTETFEVWVSIPNPNGSLLPGMTAFVHIQKPLHAYVVPRLAVLNPDRDSVVFIVRGQHAYLQHVHIIGRSYNSIYIDSGISTGQQVVLVGSYALDNGQAVHVAKVESVLSGNNLVV